MRDSCHRVEQDIKISEEKNSLMLSLTLWLSRILKQWMTMLQVPDLKAIHVNPFLNNNYRILFLVHEFAKYFTQDCYQPYRRQRGILNLQMRSLRTTDNKTNFPEVPQRAHQSTGRSLLPLLCLTPVAPVRYSVWIHSGNYLGLRDSWNHTGIYTRAAFELRQHILNTGK